MVKLLSLSPIYDWMSIVNNYRPKSEHVFQKSTNYIYVKMSKKTMHNKRPILPNEGFGFEWDVTPNYFNKNNSESEDSDKVRYNK